MKYLLIVLMVSLTQKAIAQSFPVNVNPVIHSPYSPYLSDYTEPGLQKLQVNIQLNDPTLPEYRCKFRLTIEGVGITIRTKQDFTPQPIILQGGGVPNILYGEDLAEYFNPANLDFAGISKADYTKGAKLPEGIYHDGYRDEQIERASTAELEKLMTSIDEETLKYLNDWLTDEIQMTKSTDEYINYTCFYMAYEYADAVLKSRR